MESIEKAKIICDVLSSKKAYDIVKLDVKEKTVLADYFIICSGKPSTQVRALADYAIDEVEKFGRSRFRRRNSARIQRRYSSFLSLGTPLVGRKKRGENQRLNLLTVLFLAGMPRGDCFLSFRRAVLILLNIKKWGYKSIICVFLSSTAHFLVLFSRNSSG